MLILLDHMYAIYSLRSDSLKTKPVIDQIELKLENASLHRKHRANGELVTLLIGNRYSMHLLNILEYFFNWFRKINVKIKKNFINFSFFAKQLTFIIFKLFS